MQADTRITLDRIEGYIEGFWWILPNLGIALLVSGLFLVAAGIARRAVLRVFKRRSRPDLAVMLAGAARWGVIGLGLLVVATIIFPSISPANLLSTLGIGSIAIGFAFKDILQNWLAGLLILLRQPFQQGDQVIVGKYEGTVERIEARATLLRTYDGRRVIIPNSDVYTEAVLVNTAFEQRRSEYDVGIGYGDDVEAACSVIREALGDVEGVAHEPAPEAIPWELAGSSVNTASAGGRIPSRPTLSGLGGRSSARSSKRSAGRASTCRSPPTWCCSTIRRKRQTETDSVRGRAGLPEITRLPRAI